MDFVLFVLGGLIVLAIGYDFLHTTIGTTGMGPLSKRLTRALWLLARRVSPFGHFFGLDSKNAIGPVILCLNAAFWITCNCIGYTLLFSAPEALLRAETGIAANSIERVAFSGSALSTLGASIVRPGNGWYDMISMAAAVTGMIVLTLSVSFVMNVLAATAASRGMALRISALYDARDRLTEEEISAALGGFAGPLAEIALNIRTAPLVGYFATARPEFNFPTALLMLCDMVEAIPEQKGSRAQRIELRRVLGTFGDLMRPGEGTHSLDGVRAWAREHSLERID